MYKKYLNRRNSTWDNFIIQKLKSKQPFAQINKAKFVIFDPPLYKQRYERASDILLEEVWRNSIVKVVDFGCAEFGLFVFLKNSQGKRDISFIDINEYMLREYLYRLKPLNADYVNPRRDQLTVKVLAGSISHPDPCLLNTDAVIALEIIEHVYPDVLEAIPYNIFSYIQPKLVIISTPNSDFNVLFCREGFRHPDHKFEWDREQFKSWAFNITTRFPSYTVRISGVGLGPPGTENLGCCTQLAVFIRKDIICDTYAKEFISFICTNCRRTFNAHRSTEILTCKECLPSRSHGICTYSSLSNNLFPLGVPEDSKESNYYKLIETVEYPYEIDLRTEDEKILDELRNRIFNIGYANGRFYNYEKRRSEIPIKELTYKPFRRTVTPYELRNLIQKLNCKIEQCPIEDSELSFETCVIYEPEMDVSGSGSDTEASGYESDNNKFTPNDGHISDWEDIVDPVQTTWNVQPNIDSEVPGGDEGPKTELHLEVNTGKKQQGALFDSGYQKSPSVPDESPQSISAIPEEPIALDSKNLSHDKPKQLSTILSVFDNFDKVNELDALRKEKKFFNFSSNLPPREVMKKLCQEIVKHPVAGPSRDPKKKSPKKSTSSDSDDSVEEVKSIATCILENTLNKIQLNDEEQVERGDLIQELEAIPVPEEPAEEPILIVENGDLANNNRDLEGNNYPAENPQVPDDILIDNLEVNNVNIDNNNEIVEEIVPVVENVLEEVEEAAADVEEPPLDMEVAWSSREALYDVNSQVDLLEDFDVDAAVVNGIVIPGNFIVVASAGGVSDNAVLPVEENGFPNWLLQIFDEGETEPTEEDMHDEPHFYCQGDGLGVHPSIVAVNDEGDDEDDDDEDDDDGGNEPGSDTSSSSSNGSVTFGNAENSSSIQEMFMTPEGSRHDNSLEVVGNSLTVEDQNDGAGGSENFENAEGSESSIVTNSL